MIPSTWMGDTKCSIELSVRPSTHESALKGKISISSPELTPAYMSSSRKIKIGVKGHGD